MPTATSTSLINAKIIPGALQGADISPEALHDMDDMASALTSALVGHMHDEVRARSQKTITDADVERATLKLFGEHLGMSLVQHALNVRHHG